MRRLRTELWQQMNWLLHHDNAPSHTSFFTREFFYQERKDCCPSSTLLSLIEDKTKMRHFDIIVVIEAESQAVLNTCTEHDIQDAFKHGRKAENGADARKVTASTVMVVSKLKVILFYQMALPAPEIIDVSLYASA
jgi:hypothetical protein